MTGFAAGIWSNPVALSEFFTVSALIFYDPCAPRLQCGSTTCVSQLNFVCTLSTLYFN